MSNSKTLGSNNKSWVQPPQYLALCGASSKGLMHLVLPLGIHTTTTTRPTCKKYRTGIHIFPKATDQPLDFQPSAALLTSTMATIFVNILYIRFNCLFEAKAKATSFWEDFQRLVILGHPWFWFFPWMLVIGFVWDECLRIASFWKKITLSIFLSFPLQDYCTNAPLEWHYLSISIPHLKFTCTLEEINFSGQLAKLPNRKYDYYRTWLNVS